MLLFLLSCVWKLTTKQGPKDHVEILVLLYKNYRVEKKKKKKSQTCSWAVFQSEDKDQRIKEASLDMSRNAIKYTILIQDEPAMK